MPSFAMKNSPKSWPVHIILPLLRLFGRLPLRWLHGVGSVIGRGLWIMHGRPRRLTERNLSLVLTQKSDQTRHDLAKKTLKETGKTLTESARIWTAPPQEVLALVREVRGGELLDAALAEPRGLIIAAPHLGSWELLNYWLADRALAACHCGGKRNTQLASDGRDCPRCRLAILYRPPREVSIEPLLLRLRAALPVDQIRAEGPGVRRLYRRLASGGTVGILPDQQPRAGEGVMAPFFGVPASTMVLLSRLAERTRANVLFSFAERLPRGAGYRVHVLPAPDAIADADITTACTALNLGVENCARLAFTQYQWHYKRFPTELT